MRPLKLLSILTSFAGFFWLSTVIGFAQTHPHQKSVLVSGPSREGVVINRRVLQDFGKDVKSRIESRSIDLDSPFSIELTGVIEKSGKMDPATIKYTRTEGGKEIVNVVKKAIESINDSGYLAYLSHLGPKGPVIIRASQDDSTFDSSISVEMESESSARTVASGLQMLTQVAKLKANDDPAVDKDELLILNSITASAEGKTSLIKLNMPKSSFREMIERKLAENTPPTKSQ